MPRTPLTFDAVRKLALEMTGVEAGTSYGAPALKVNGNVFASVPVNKSAEANSAVFRIDFVMRSSLLQARPEIYYITDHYSGYPTVLVRLSKISRGELRELLSLSWNFIAAKKPARASKVRKQRG
jgi:hypothetical protein